MIRIRGVLPVVLFAMLASCSPARAADNLSCRECGMPVDQHSPFASKILQGGGVLHFCDIGDLLSYLKRKKPGNVKAEVKDYPSGAWIDAGQAFYIRSAGRFTTPMGWGIAAFSDKNEASKSGSPRDFESMIKALYE